MMFFLFVTLLRKFIVRCLTIHFYVRGGDLVIYEGKGFKISIDDGVMKVEEGGRKLNIDLKIYVKEQKNG